VIGEKSASMSVSSVSDGTNSYSLGRSATWDGTNLELTEVWYKENASAVAAGATITVTFSATTGPGSSNINIVGACYITGAATSSSLDKVNSTTATTTTTPASGSTGALTNAYEIAIGVIGYYRSAGASAVTEARGSLKYSIPTKA
jgi:hypothetical protein